MEAAQHAEPKAHSTHKSSTDSSHNAGNGTHRKTAARAKTQRGSGHSRDAFNINDRLTALQDGAASAVDSVTETLTKLADQTRQSSQAMTDSIARNPKTSVLLAFGVGYIYARLRRIL